MNENTIEAISIYWLSHVPSLDPMTVIDRLLFAGYSPSEPNSLGLPYNNSTRRQIRQTIIHDLLRPENKMKTRALFPRLSMLVFNSHLWCLAFVWRNQTWMQAGNDSNGRSTGCDQPAIISAGYTAVRPRAQQRWSRTWEIVAIAASCKIYDTQSQALQLCSLGMCSNIHIRFEP